MVVKSRKKILFVSPIGEFFGGGERSGFQFCQFLEKNGYEVITTIPETSKTYKKLLEKFGMKYYSTVGGDSESQMWRGAIFARIVPQLVEIIRKEKISFVITNLYAQSGPMAAVIAGVPNISMDRGQAYETTMYMDFMVRFSDAVVVNSTGLADIYEQQYAIETPVVYSYTPVPKIGLDHTKEERSLVCVSRISPEKDLKQVLKAMRLLKERKIFDGKILMIGPTPNQAEKTYKEELESYARENGIDENIRWLGDQENPWSFVGDKDIYLNTSRKESVGRSNIEAIKLGVPAILVDIIGHKDIFELIGAISYKPNDTEDLVSKIEYVIKNYSKIKSDSKKAQAKAERVISEHNCNKNILPLLKKIEGKSNVMVDSMVEYLLDNIYESRDALASRSQEVVLLNSEIAKRDLEIASYLGIKRSARILAGNIMRRVRSKIGL